MQVSHVGVVACPQARQHRLLRRHHCRLRVQLHLHRFRAVSYIAAPLDLLAFPWSACGIPGAFRHRFDIWSAPRWLCLGRPHTFLLPWLPGPSFVRAVSGTPYARVFAVFLGHIPFAVRVFVLPWEQCVQLRIAVLGLPSGLSPCGGILFVFRRTLRIWPVRVKGDSCNSGTVRLPWLFAVVLFDSVPCIPYPIVAT